MPITDLSAAIPYSDGTIYPPGTLGYRIQQLLSEIISGSVPDGSITAIKLAADAVTNVKIIDGAINTPKLGDDVVTYAKMQNIGTDALLGRTSSGTGDLEPIFIHDFVQSLLAIATPGAMRTALGLVIGTDVQANDADLTAIAALVSAADKVPYATDVGTWALADFPAAGRALAASGASADLVASVNRQTGTTYTAQASDRGKILEITNAAAIALTLPPTMAADTYFTLIQGGAGQITCASSGSGAVRNRQSQFKTAGQWAGCSLWVRANAGGSAAEWVLTGDTAA